VFLPCAGCCSRVSSKALSTTQAPLSSTTLQHPCVHAGALAHTGHSVLLCRCCSGCLAHLSLQPFLPPENTFLPFMAGALCLFLPSLPWVRAASPSPRQPLSPPFPWVPTYCSVGSLGGSVF
jgi:hypothetical protein